MTVHVLGIRHHGPGSARSVRAALEELQPDLVLIEGPVELDTLVPLARSPELVPPVAGLVYAVEQPRRALFYPLAVFSPEWVALRWAVEQTVEVAFADLPAVHQLAAPGDDDEPVRPHRPDAIGMLAVTAGYDDAERWWEDAVEHRRGSVLDRFTAVSEAMAEVRAASPTDAPDLENDRREAWMRKVIRAAMKTRERIAFVCGAYHAPALDPATYPPATRDNKLLAGLPRTKVAATWAPWTASRLAFASGYGAGVTSPGWYQHLYVEPDDVVEKWLVRVARALRSEQLDASPASIVEAARLADALAAVRGRPSVGLTELNDATQAVLCEGSPLPLRLIDRKLVIGEQLGSVPADTPMVPLAADLARQQRALKLRPSASATVVQLDLRRPPQLARSVLLHRLNLLGIRWGEQVDAGRSTGTFKEAWELVWEPELTVAVIEASVHGTTLVSAAESKVSEAAEASEDLGTLGTLIEQCLLAELPVARVVQSLAERAARQHDTLALLQAVEPLARTRRYGDVRGADTSEVGHVLETTLVRAAVGLRAACAALDEEGAEYARQAIEAAHRGVTLLDTEELRGPWLAALTAVGADEGIHGAVSGRVNRLLLDGGIVDREEAGRRLSRRLSLAAPAPAAAAWLDGFLAGEALLLLHDDDLLTLVDAWVAGVADETFEDLLPLLRRTFSRYEPAERRQVGTRLRNLGAGRPRASAAESDLEPDLARALPAVHRVAALLGLEVSR